MPNYASRKGITQVRGVCPACGREVAGGVESPSGRVILRRHKRLDGAPIKSGYAEWCSGGQRVEAVRDGR